MRDCSRSRTEVTHQVTHHRTADCSGQPRTRVVPNDHRRQAILRRTLTMTDLDGHCIGGEGGIRTLGPPQEGQRFSRPPRSTAPAPLHPNGCKHLPRATAEHQPNENLTWHQLARGGLRGGFGTRFHHRLDGARRRMVGRGEGMRVEALSRQLFRARIETQDSLRVMPLRQHLATVRSLRPGRSAVWIGR
jgi:hypothetical protein